MCLIVIAIVCCVLFVCFDCLAVRLFGVYLALLIFWLMCWFGLLSGMLHELFVYALWW